MARGLVYNESYAVEMSLDSCLIRDFFCFMNFRFTLGGFFFASIRRNRGGRAANGFSAHHAFLHTGNFGLFSQFLWCGLRDEQHYIPNFG